MLYIFDWDGTVMDSADKIVRCMQRAAEDTGHEVFGSEQVKNIIGLGLPEAIKTLYPESEPADREQLQHHYVRHFLVEDENPCAFFPGVCATFDLLRQQGHVLAVATGKSRRGLSRVLARSGVESYFQATRCADETASKPNPLMLEQLLEECNMTCDQAVMIGDTEYDMAMAAAIGMHRIAVSFGAHHIDRLKPYDPVLCVDHFEHILHWQK